MVESLTQHLDLDDAIQRSVVKSVEDRRLFVVALFAVNDIRVEPALLVQRPDFPRMVDRACHRDQLMAGPALPKLLQLLQAAIDDVLVTGTRKRDTPAEPVLFLKLENLVETVGTAAIVAKSQLDF